MQEKGRPSWVIEEDEGWLPTAALYLRDALRLEIAGELDVPRLTPPVPAADGAPPPDRSRAVSWAWWFRRLVADELPPSTDPLAQLADTAPRLDTGPRLAALVEDAAAWATASKNRQAADFLHQTDDEHLLINYIVDGVQRDRGRPIRPFRLRIRTLPVQGHWARWVTPEIALVSTATRAEAAAFTRFLEPAVRHAG